MLRKRKKLIFYGWFTWSHCLSFDDAIQVLKIEISVSGKILQDVNVVQDVYEWIYFCCFCSMDHVRLKKHPRHRLLLATETKYAIQWMSKVAKNWFINLVRFFSFRSSCCSKWTTKRKKFYSETILQCIKAYITWKKSMPDCQFFRFTFNLKFIRWVRWNLIRLSELIESFRESRIFFSRNHIKFPIATAPRWQLPLTVHCKTNFIIDCFKLNFKEKKWLNFKSLPKFNESTFQLGQCVIPYIKISVWCRCVAATTTMVFEKQIYRFIAYAMFVPFHFPSSASSAATRCNWWNRTQYGI